MPSLTRRQRIRGGLLGLLVGDAVGVPYEFTAPEAIPPQAQIEMAPPPGFSRAHARVPIGTWSDDGAQALCLLGSLLERGRMDVDDFARKLVAWYEDGYLAVDGNAFDVGVQTGAALRRLREGVSALQAGSRDGSGHGNGALMRVLPLALWHRGTDAELARDAALSSVVTHDQARSRACCALYCLWARRLLAGEPAAWPAAVATLRALAVGDADLEEAIEFHIRPDEPLAGRGTGYVVDTLRSAAMLLGRGAYVDVVQGAIALGHDTDTTACVAGGVAGVRDGEAAIPPRWLAALRGRALVDPLLEALLALRGD